MPILNTEVKNHACIKKGITIYNLLHSTQLTVNCVSHMVERNKVTTVIDVLHTKKAGCIDIRKADIAQYA